MLQQLVAHLERMEFLHIFLDNVQRIRNQSHRHHLIHRKVEVHLIVASGCELGFL